MGCTVTHWEPRSNVVFAAFPPRCGKPLYTVLSTRDYYRRLYNYKCRTWTMAQVPTPPASRQTSESPEVQHKGEGQAAAGVDVDSLLERYLGLLDRHQKLQADLAKQLSSVCLKTAMERENIWGRWQCADVQTGIPVAGPGQLHLPTGPPIWRGLLRRTDEGYPEGVSMEALLSAGHETDRIDCCTRHNRSSMNRTTPGQRTPVSSPLRLAPNRSQNKEHNRRTNRKQPKILQ